MISFARQDLILRPIEKRLYLFADERSEGENNSGVNERNWPIHSFTQSHNMHNDSYMYEDDSSVG